MPHGWYGTTGASEWFGTVRLSRRHFTPRCRGSAQGTLPGDGSAGRLCRVSNGGAEADYFDGRTDVVGPDDGSPGHDGYGGAG